MFVPEFYVLTSRHSSHVWDSLFVCLYQSSTCSRADTPSHGPPQCNKARGNTMTLKPITPHTTKRLPPHFFLHYIIHHGQDSILDVTVFDWSCCKREKCHELTPANRAFMTQNTKFSCATSLLISLSDCSMSLILMPWCLNRSNNT